MDLLVRSSDLLPFGLHRLVLVLQQVGGHLHLCVHGADFLAVSLHALVFVPQPVDGHLGLLVLWPELVHWYLHQNVLGWVLVPRHLQLHVLGREPDFRHLHGHLIWHLHGLVPEYRLCPLPPGAGLPLLLVPLELWQQGQEHCGEQADCDLGRRKTRSYSLILTTGRKLKQLLRSS